MSPRQWLNAYGQRYARPWAKYDEMIAQLKPELRWPEWCWCPVAASYAIVSSAAGPASDIGALAGLAAWRVGQGIYRFPEALERELWATPVAGAIPSDVLQRLPEYCCYLPTPNVGGALEGFWAFLEWDANDCHCELRLVLNLGEHLVPFALPVDGRLSIEESIQRLVSSAVWRAQRSGIELAPDIGPLEMWHGMVSLTLYLCSRNAEIRPINADAAKRGMPERAQPTRTRHGLRYYPPDAPLQWEPGSRIGPALAAALERSRANRDGAGRSPRAHVRRAHWHTYRVGSGRQLSELRWLHPILVGGGADDLSETIREIPENR